LAAFLFMGKKKSKQTQQSQQSFSNQNTYGQITPTDTADISAFREWKPQIDPGLGAQYGAAKNRLRSSFINPLGGYATAGMQDAQQRTGERNLNQDESQAYRNAYYDQNQQRAGQLSGLAALTSPRIVNTGSSGSSMGSGTGTAVQSGDLLGQLLSGGAQVGSAALL
jgi:hypothetical protein